MNLKNKTVDNLATSILDDIKMDFEILKKAYLESDEFKALVASKVNEINSLLDKANEMYFAVDEIPELSYITLGEHTFEYNSVLDVFEHAQNIEVTARNIVLAELAFDKFKNYSNTIKGDYIKNKVFGITSTLDDSVNHEQALKIVRSQINLEEILHNKNI